MREQLLPPLGTKEATVHEGRPRRRQLSKNTAVLEGRTTVLGGGSVGVRLGCGGVMVTSAASQGGAEGLMVSFCGGEIPL